ncbi:MAG: glycine radical domain-containing protein, partial [Candidatus Hermodarchaeota archaeon]
ISPSNGVERCGPTAVIKSCAKLNQIKMSNGCSLNIKINPSFLIEGERREKFIAILKSFVKLNAMHTQFNAIDNKTLLEAQKNTDNYIDLVVRVSGYSAYFNDLGKPVQDDIIRRTLFNNY